MSRDEIEKLLGGYATGTLTPEERNSLFAAALEDQQLFEALAREEPLRELLADPVAKTRLQAALEQKREPGYLRWLRPAAWAIPAVGLAAVVVMFIAQRQETRPVMIAQAPTLPRVGPVEPVPSALPEKLEKRELPLIARAIKAAPPDTLKRQETPAQAKDAPEQTDAVSTVTGQAVMVAPAAPQPRAAAPPPPPALPVPLNPPAATQQVAVEAGQSQLGQQGSQNAGGVRVQAAETVQLQLGGISGFAQQQDARALFFGQTNPGLVQTNSVDVETRARKKAVATAAPAARGGGGAVARQIGLRYSVQQQLANGTAAVIPNEVLDAREQITLKLEPNEAGYLSVFERAADIWREISNSRVERLTSYTVPARGALTYDSSARIELFVVFSRDPRQTPYPVPEARLDQVMSVNYQERMTYVVSTASPVQGQTIAFPITLTHK